jgi:hypothetical protein
MGSSVRLGRKSSKGADLDVAEPNVVAVILQADVAAGILGEAGHALEFGFGDQFLGLGATPLVLDDLLLVEPVLGLIAFDHNAGLVPFAHGLEFFLGIAGDEGVKSGGAGLGVFSVAVLGVIENLVFRACLVGGVVVFG